MYLQVFTYCVPIEQYRSRKGGEAHIRWVAATFDGLLQLGWSSHCISEIKEK